MWSTIVREAEAESPLWAQSALPDARRRPLPVFSLLADEPFRLGIETIYEGYLLHYGRSRLFAPPDDDVALLLGDYLYAHGLVRIAALGDPEAVSRLAELISLCAHLRSEGRPGDGSAWAATAALLARGGLEEGRDALRSRGDPAPLERRAREAAGEDAVDRALAAHAAVVG